MLIYHRVCQEHRMYDKKMKEEIEQANQNDYQ
jgi:hypothetical protein